VDPRPVANLNKANEKKPGQTIIPRQPWASRNLVHFDGKETRPRRTSSSWPPQRRAKGRFGPRPGHPRRRSSSTWGRRQRRRRQGPTRAWPNWTRAKTWFARSPARRSRRAAFDSALQYTRGAGAGRQGRQRASKERAFELLENVTCRDTSMFVAVFGTPLTTG